MSLAASEGPEPRERLCPDDEAQRTADLFIEDARAQQRLRAQRNPLGVPGVCSNCGERCLPTAVYCDAECRSDHEARSRADSRLRGS